MCASVPQIFIIMSQYQDHPFVLLINKIFPLLLPSFTLRSVRDKESYPEKYPLIDYVIIRGGRETFDRAKNTFRSQIDVQIDLLVKESEPLSWCEFDELKDAQSRQALFNFLHNRIREFIKMAVNPNKLDPKNLKVCDILWKDYDFQFVQTIGTEYHNKHTHKKLTGVSSVMQFSYIPQEDEVCCLNDGSYEFWTNLQRIVFKDSTSFKLIQNIIDAL